MKHNLIIDTSSHPHTHTHIHIQTLSLSFVVSPPPPSPPAPSTPVSSRPSRPGPAARRSGRFSWARTPRSRTCLGGWVCWGVGVVGLGEGEEGESEHIRQSASPTYTHVYTYTNMDTQPTPKTQEHQKKRTAEPPGAALGGGLDVVKEQDFGPQVGRLLGRRESAAVVLVVVVVLYVFAWSVGMRVTQGFDSTRFDRPPNAFHHHTTTLDIRPPHDQNTRTYTDLPPPMTIRS